MDAQRRDLAIGQVVEDRIRDGHLPAGGGDAGELAGVGADEDRLGDAERSQHVDVPYPCGESWTEAVHRVGRFLDDLSLRRSGCRVLLIGHVATRWGLDHLINDVPLSDLCATDFAWQAGWEYTLQ